MGFGEALTRASLGLEAPLVRAELQVEGGLYSFAIVGLPETAVRESRDRVRGALQNCRFAAPDRRVVANLAPAELPKSGSRFDLAIALAYLAATGQLPQEPLRRIECVGELSLTGQLRPVRGVLAAARAAAAAGRDLVVPLENAEEALLPRQGRVIACGHLLELTAHLLGDTPLAPARPAAPPPRRRPAPALARIRGHSGPKRALTIAAAGRHNLLMSGPPGTGKTLLARALPSLLPPLTRDEALEIAAIHALAGDPPRTLRERPFRAPHHSASAVAIAGGGTDPRPGEISLAHRGVLFLDEIPEFGRAVLENLREPLESGEIVIARSRARVSFPARFQLVAAMNPCPAGHACTGAADCVCPPDAARRYRARISGPLLDRIDLHVQVPPVPAEVLRAAFQPTHPEPDEDDRAREAVSAAHDRALARQGAANADLSVAQTERFCAPDAEGLELLERATQRLGLSARSWHRCLRVARTIADLEASSDVLRSHVAEALAYRPAPARGASEPLAGSAAVPTVT
ncbi:MAG: YifB family Mg chelatase-like AAA ATPase [Pseudomonadales bacterium]|jgi:magnesium chelatase family protein|nr:YifB family Mg chelatase-like AAA ATPase [Pseudomonadales bacterium]